MEKNIDVDLIIMGGMAAMVGSCCSAPPPSESPRGDLLIVHTDG